jgi:epsilon-lactone hydrolase
MTSDHVVGPQHGPQQYEISVRGHLGETLISAFPALRAQLSGEDTVLTGALPDQAALYGVLAELEAFGLELLEVRRLPPPGPAARRKSSGS